MAGLEAVGYLAALLMGAVLGLVGGGGSILTVPILVYLFRIEATVATAYSLFIVGLSAIFGGIAYSRQRLVDFRTGIIFSIPAFLGVYLVRKLVNPNLPDVIFSLGSFSMSKNAFVLEVFALVMLAAAVSMIRTPKKKSTPSNEKETMEVSPKGFWKWGLVGVEGLLVGGLTGFVGAGGGFLIIPALVLLAGLEMKVAVGTSLFIIAIKSLIGFMGDIQSGLELNWQLLGVFSAISVIGIFIGTYLSRHIPSERLKPAFGWFVLVMGAAILISELS